MYRQSYFITRKLISQAPLFFFHRFITSVNCVVGTKNGVIVSRTNVRCSNAYAKEMSFSSLNARPKKLSPKGMFGASSTSPLDVVRTLVLFGSAPRGTVTPGNPAIAIRPGAISR